MVDALTHTYLLRYVDDPATTLAELARVIRPGGVMASLEFGVPTSVAYPAWRMWTRSRPAHARSARRAGMGRDRPFPGTEHRGVLGALPTRDVLKMWTDAGMGRIRVQRLSLGGGIIISGIRE